MKCVFIGGNVNRNKANIQFITKDKWEKRHDLIGGASLMEEEEEEDEDADKKNKKRKNVTFCWSRKNENFGF